MQFGENREQRYKITHQGRVMKFEGTAHRYKIHNLTIPSTVEHLVLSSWYDEKFEVRFNKNIKLIKIGWGLPFKLENLPLTIKTAIMNDAYSIVYNMPMSTTNILMNEYFEIQWKSDRNEFTKQNKIPFGSTYKQNDNKYKLNKINLKK